MGSKSSFRYRNCKVMISGFSADIATSVFTTEPGGRVSIKVGLSMTEIQSVSDSAMRANRPGIPFRNFTGSVALC